MIEAEDRAAQQRSFYLKLSPQGLGEMISQSMGFTPPGPDSMEAEAVQNVGLWMKLHASGAFSTIVDASWWMTGFMDRPARMTRQESATRSDELIAYACATIGLLMDKGVLKFTKEPEIPKLVPSTFDPVNDDITQAVLDRMEAMLKQEDGKE